MLVGGERQGVLFRAAAPGAVEPRVVAAIDELFGLVSDDTLRYEDARRGVGRAVRVGADGAIDAVRLAGDVAAESWLRDLFDRGLLQRVNSNLTLLSCSPDATAKDPDRSSC